MYGSTPLGLLELGALSAAVGAPAAIGINAAIGLALWLPVAGRRCCKTSRVGA